MSNPSASSYLPPDVARDVMRYVCDEHTVIVGGQAVMLWAYYYGLIEADASLTRDIDIFGNAADLASADLRLAAVQHRVVYADLDDASVNSGMIQITLPQMEEPITVDYLWSVVGLGGSDIQQQALTLQIQGLELPLRVLSPLMCLESKIANLGRLPTKRHSAGVAQARLAAEVVSEFIWQEWANKDAVRATFNAFERIGNIAALGAACYAFCVAKIDVLACIRSVLARLPAQARQTTYEEFVQIRWPQIEARATAARAPVAKQLPADASFGNTQTLRF